MIVDNLKKLLSKNIYSKIVAEDRILDNIEPNWIFAILRFRDISNTFYWTSHILMNTRENHIIRATANGNVNYGQLRYQDGTIKYYPRGENNSEIEMCQFFYYK